MEFNDKKLANNVDEFKTKLLEIGLNPTQIAAVLKLRAEEAFQTQQRFLSLQEKELARLAAHRERVRKYRTKQNQRSCDITEKPCDITCDITEKPEQNQQSCDITNGHIYNYSKKERKKDNIALGDITADFEEFYKLYPRKKERSAALAAYLKARKVASKEEILQGVANLIAANLDPKYIKYPATWLNKGCWLDEPDKISPKSEPKQKWLFGVPGLT